MPDPAPDPGEASRLTALQRIQARRRNEQLKLVAASFDRLSTVVLAGAVLAPLFQHNPGGWQETIAWIAAALLLHAASHIVLQLIIEES